MQGKQEIADSIFTSIDVIVDRKLEQLAFDKTIIGEIIATPYENKSQCYTVRYQDRTIDAVPIGAVSYNKKNMVYVVTPNNNNKYMSFILGLYNIEDLQNATSVHSLALEEEILRLQYEQKILLEAVNLSLDGKIDEARLKLKEIGGE